MNAVFYNSQHASAIFDCFPWMMFNFFFEAKAPCNYTANHFSSNRFLISMRLILTAPLLLMILAALAGCGSLAPLPEADLKQPGWVVHQGQAIWRPKRGGTEIAGELLVATRPGGDVFVQFTKEPFPMVIARGSSSQWQIESPLQNRRYSGRGRPPSRVIWLSLASAVSGEPLPKGWSWQKLENNQWRLSNASSGETLEGYFNP
jgi:predicted small lipoprotein YifL